MKNKFTKLISSLLVLAFLVSCMTVFVSANDTYTGADTGNTETIEENVTVIVNRTFDEGWNYLNGFTSSVGDTLFEVDYEETDDFSYNYFTRAESVNGTSGYVNVAYSANVVKYGATVFELDLKTDDLCKFGNPIIYFKSADAKKIEFKLAGISNNALTLVPEGTIALTDKGEPQSGSTSYSVGSLENGWIHVAFVTTANQRICPNCNEIYALDGSENENTVVCTCNADPNVEGSGTTVGSMTKAITTRVFFGYTDTFDVNNAQSAPKKSSKIDLNSTYYYDITTIGITTVDSYSIGIPKGASAVGHSICYDNVRAYNYDDVKSDRNDYKPLKKLPVSGTTDEEIEQSKYGLNVDITQAKTEQIIGSAFGKTVMQYVNEGLVMKVGYAYCIDAGTKKAILENKEGKAYGAPVDIDGDIYVSLQAILDWIGYPMYQHEDGLSFDISTENGSTFITIGRTTATVNGQLVELDIAPGLATDNETGEKYVVISKNDVPKIFSGYYVTYDDMGLMVISTGENIFTREADLEIMLDVMKSFIFETAVGEEVYNLAKENTNNFQHPYLLADQAYFASLYATYQMAEGDLGYDATFKAYLDKVVADADAIFAEYTTVSEENSGTEDDSSASDGSSNTEASEDAESSTVSKYKYLRKSLSNPYVGQGNNGYDTAGRNAVLVEYTESMKLLALAYQITGEIKYSDLAYDVAVSLSKWDHWAPAYFIDCANATANYALTYDWLYNTWSSTAGCDLSLIESTIYQKGLSMGYNFSNGVALNAALSSNQGVYAVYNTQTNSWNAIGTSGMAIASLALLGTDYLNNGNDYELDSENDEEKIDTVEGTYVKTAAWLIENNIASLMDIGLDMYAPDGSFIESAEYWSYSIEALMLLIWACDSTLGMDFGLSNLWGLDNTFYYAFQTEYKVGITENNPSGYEYWNYNEAVGGTLSTDIAFYAAEVLGDDVIAALRVSQLEKKGLSMWDVLAYDARYYETELDMSAFPLDYSLESCEGIVSRSGWDEDSLYVGMMGNDNNAPSGQIDSGNFIYANKGYTWFCDLGSENYGVYGYNNVNYRYGYYRHTGEGANVVLITTSANASAMPYGQVLEAGGTFIDYYTNDYGMYAILDNVEVYGGKANQARRGMLLTNDRNTVVIQDEISFVEAEACKWVAQTAATSIILTNYNKTAYLTQVVNGETVVLRASIVEPGDSLEFKIYNTTATLLTGTNKGNFSTGQGGDEEYSREGLQRLVIEQNEMNTFQCAIVLEIVYGTSDTAEVQYEYTSMDFWTEDMVSETFQATEVDMNVMGERTVINIYNYTLEAAGYSRPFADDINAFFRAMARAYDSIKVFEPSGVLYRFSYVKDAYENDYIPLAEKYEYFRQDINSYTKANKTIATYLCGYN